MGSDRRDQFRTYYRRMDPKADPLVAFREGHYIPPPGAVSPRIRTRLVLDPSSSHLMAGAIGSGKTTELIALEDALNQGGEVLAARLDVLKMQRWEQVGPGTLVALAILATLDALEQRPEPAETTSEVRTLLKTLRREFRDGYWRDYHPDPHEPDDEIVFVQPKVQPVEPNAEVTALEPKLAEILKLLPKPLVLLLDGLDRLNKHRSLRERFSTLMQDDIPALARSGVGLVVVGPQDVLYGAQRSTRSIFSHFYMSGAAPFDSPEGLAFLCRVLRARAPEALLPDQTCERLATWSGGLLRMLMTLARGAGELAYEDGSEVIEPKHADMAADSLGRELLLGVDKARVDRLRQLVPQERWDRPKDPPQFTLATDTDINLVLERLLVEIPGTPARYKVHPTVLPLVPGLAGAA